ncbi:MAG TPA: hypothetical protein VFV46_02000 [Lacibacter sp.]|nr:hypothetical protein [Lacibacter sp.]
MRFILLILTISPLFGFSQQNKEDKNGRIQVERLPIRNDSSKVKGSFLTFLAMKN